MPYGTTSSSTIVWTNWTATDSTTSITFNDPWQGWVTNSISFDNVTVNANLEPPPPPTPEQLAAREERRLEAQRAQEEANERARVKRERAKQLLAGALTDGQVEELRDHGYFHVETRKGKRRYRLAPGASPCRVLGEDKRQWSYCIHPVGGYPPEDVVLAQKLLLESDEDAFLRIANASAIRV